MIFCTIFLKCVDTKRFGSYVYDIVGQYKGFGTLVCRVVYIYIICGKLHSPLCDLVKRLGNPICEVGLIYIMYGNSRDGFYTLSHKTRRCFSGARVQAKR